MPNGALARSRLLPEVFKGAHDEACLSRSDAQQAIRDHYARIAVMVVPGIVASSDRKRWATTSSAMSCALGIQHELARAGAAWMPADDPRATVGASGSHQRSRPFDQIGESRRRAGGPPHRPDRRHHGPC